MATDLYTPSSGSGLQTANSFIEATKVGKEFVLDRVIDTLFISGDVTLPNLTTTDAIKTMGAGARSITEINSSGVAGICLTTDADEYECLWKLPAGIDLTEEINFRLLVTDVSATLGSYLFTIPYTALTAGTTAISIGATALDTILVDCNHPVRYAPDWTEWGTISASKTGVVTLRPGEDSLALKITLTTLTTLSDAYLLGMQARYYRKFIN